MTPNRRLDQLEPLMAESLQKIDRLVEGQGQLLEVYTRADQKADTTARGLANLTITVQEGFAIIRTDVANTDQKLEELRTEMNQRFDQIIELLRQR